MALRIGYIGDSLTSAGLSLVGVTPYPSSQEPSAVRETLLRVRDRSDLIILNQAHAHSVKEGVGELIRRQPIPPIVVIPSIDSDDGFEHSAIESARRILGIV